MKAKATDGGTRIVVEASGQTFHFEAGPEPVFLGCSTEGTFYDTAPDLVYEKAQQFFEANLR